MQHINYALAFARTSVSTYMHMSVHDDVRKSNQLCPGLAIIQKWNPMRFRIVSTMLRRKLVLGAHAKLLAALGVPKKLRFGAVDHC